MRKIKYFLSFIIVIGVLNVAKIYIDNDSKYMMPKIEINEELVFQTEKELNYIDINKASLEDLVNIGISKKSAIKVIEIRNFLGNIYSPRQINNIKGIKKEDRKIIIDKLVINSDEDKYIKRNINLLTSEELSLLGFNKKEIKYILELKEKGIINSDIDLKDKVNKEILSKYIFFE